MRRNFADVLQLHPRADGQCECDGDEHLGLDFEATPCGQRIEGGVDSALDGISLIGTTA